MALPVSMLFARGLGAQTRVYGGNPFLNEFYSLDVDTGATLSTVAVSVQGRTIGGINAVTVDPTTGKMYAVVREFSGLRLLITIDPATAVGVEIGNLGDRFSSLAFRSDGQLFGTTGEAAMFDEGLYLIDKTNATTVFAAALGNGDRGEVIAYSPADAFLYHWSGSTTPVFERIQSEAPYTVTDVPIIGTPTSEVLGALWDCRNNRFVASNGNLRFQAYAADGTLGAEYGALVNRLRGMAMLTCTDPIFADGFE